MCLNYPAISNKITVIWLVLVSKAHLTNTIMYYSLILP